MTIERTNRGASLHGYLFFVDASAETAELAFVRMKYGAPAAGDRNIFSALLRAIFARCSC